mgnify:CR=1 FL=1
MLPEPGVIDNSVFAVEAARFLSQQHVGIKDNKYKTLARLWEDNPDLLSKCNQVSNRLYEVKQTIRDLLNEETICPTSTISEEEAKVYGPKLNLLKFIIIFIYCEKQDIIFNWYCWYFINDGRSIIFFN